MNNSKKTLFIIAGILAIFNFLLGVGIALSSAFSSDFVNIIFNSMFLEAQASQTIPAEVINSFRNFLIAFSLIMAVANAVVVTVAFYNGFSKKQRNIKSLNIFAVILAFLFSNIITTILLAIATLQNSNMQTPLVSENEKSDTNKEKLSKDLQEIREMRASGAITEEEYKAMVLERFNDFM